METALSLKNEGNRLFKEGKYEEAQKKYTEALKYDSTNSVIYSNRSVTHLKSKNYEEALSDAVKCIELNPQWSKGFLRKAMALEGLGKHDEVVHSACEGFRFSGEGSIKRELVSLWLTANQRQNSLPKDSIELPRGILILSRDYLQVLACLIRSLNGECPLSLALMEQCLYSCAEQIEKVVADFGEPVDPIIKEWARCLPYEVYPYSVNPVAKVELEHQMSARSEVFTRYLNKDVDSTIYPLLRPMLGLVVLVVLNRTNILAECNTGHHSAELMNRALLPLFETSILSTHDYCSMYIGRLCAVLDSFIGRGYRLAANEISSVHHCYGQLEKAIQNYPRSLPEYQKDQQLAERALSNVKNNILLPASSSPPMVPMGSTMSVEIAERLVKQKPKEVEVYLKKHVQELEAVKFLTMGEVEELLTMSGIFHELKMNEDAYKVFGKGESAFFQVLGHMLTSHTLMLDQCPATIAPLRQLVLSEASLLKQPVVFANVALRWKCLFKEFRSQLLHRSSDEKIFGDFFQWYMKSKTSELDADETQSAVLKQMQKEEELLRTFSNTVLQGMYETSYEHLQKVLHTDAVTVDFIFFAPLKENPLLDAYCVFFESSKTPVVCELDYRAIRNQSAVVTQVLLSKSSVSQVKLQFELACLAKVLFPKELLDVLAAGRISHLYISPDSDIAHIPLDLLPIHFEASDKALPLFEKFSVCILSSLRKLLNLGTLTTSSQEENTCSLIGNPNFDLCKPDSSSLSFGKVIDFFCGYFGISSSTGPLLEQLEHSQDEIDCITEDLQSHKLSVECISGDAATLTKVLSIHNPLLIHVSSHAYSTYGRSITAFRGNFYDDLKSCAIALAGFNTFSRKQFEKLPSECGPTQLSPLAVLSMKLKGTKLVFLSTCGSAAGTVPIQEAVDSLAEAFLSAGVETVIATLWPVEDKVAADISKLFYKKVTALGVRPSEALGYAKKCLRDSTKESPSLSYAAFVCYGMDQPIFV